MKRRITWLILSFLMALSLVLVSCGEAVEEEEEEEGPPPMEEEEEEEEEEGPPVTGNWWDKFGKPEYGGKITLTTSSLANASFDPKTVMGTSVQYHLEPLFSFDWTVDREIWPYNASWAPPEYFTGLLVESWEQIDPTTLTLHLHEGVYWHDKLPVNGREFTADDVQYTYDRIMGTGSGFTRPDPFLGPSVSTVERVVATDKYTVEFRLKQPSAVAVIQTVGSGGIIPREWVQHGDTKNWQTAVGTGPWVLTDFIGGSSATYSANPNYWANDERHPQNQLPYAETLKIVAISDLSTRLSALRTGKIDLIIGGGIGGENVPWQQAQSLAKTNPEIRQVMVPGTGVSIDLKCDAEPFNDINVRKALQMSIDRETIAKTHLGGTIDGTPCGLVSRAFEDWVPIAYENWPAELQAEYSYNPERARELLAEAGYPNGFKTIIVASTTGDLDLLQIIKAQFMDIGVDMEIQAMDRATWMAVAGAAKSNQMTYASACGFLFAPQQTLWQRTSQCPFNYSFAKDEHYDSLFIQFEATPTMEEAKQILVEADMYALQQHWGVNVVDSLVGYTVWQPYIKGYSGEGGPPPPGIAIPCMMARLWIDQDMKKSMGH